MKLKQLSILFIIGTLFAQMRTLPADTAVVTYHRTNIGVKELSIVLQLERSHSGAIHQINLLLGCTIPITSEQM